MEHVDLVVARIGAARGLRGEVRLDVRSDDPDRRLVPGATFATDPPQAGPLTLGSVRRERGGWLAVFAEAADRSAAEGLRGVALLAPPTEPEEDAWYPHELVGVAVELADGTLVGQVEGIEHRPAQDVLVVRERTGDLTLVPFVRAIVPLVDPAAGRIVLDPPDGLLAESGEDG